jgi:XTP/dITP diphosphohydrolase
VTVKIFLATRNKGKIREIRSILSGAGVELIDAGDVEPYPEPVENGETFLENALVKARAAYEATGLPSLADDSGLEVESLDGRPGVRSARYGGDGITDGDRCRKLLDELSGIPPERRDAHFHCTMVLYPRPGHADGYLATEGYLYGRVAERPAGSNGFGYDPVFLLPERGVTVAQLPIDEKNSISHRYRALVEMKWLLVRECGIVANNLSE